ncbi:hypothetical protein AZA_47583 [Nitrospirillum viridazoti Y2]|nr:hypothetical protein AZA_47583 [Nitrospirillum amazonense Y2]
MDETGVMEADPGAGDGAAVRQRADGAQVGDGGAADAADHAAGVGQGAEGAGLGHVKGGAVLNAERPGIAQAGVGAADIVVQRHPHQGGTGNGAAKGQAGGVIGHHHAGVVGAGAAGDQCPHCAALQVIAGGGTDQLHLPAVQAGAAAGCQLTGARHQDQGAARLGIVAGDADGAGQGQIGAGVPDRVAADIDAVVQQHVAGCEDDVAQGVGDDALVGQGGAGKGADPDGGVAQRATRDGQVGRGGGVVDDVAGDGTAVGQHEELAQASDVQRGGATDHAAVEVEDGAQPTAVLHLDAAADPPHIAQREHRTTAADGDSGDAAVVQGEHDAAAVHRQAGRLARQGAVVAEEGDGAAAVAQAIGAAGDRPVIQQRADGADIAQTGVLAHQRGAVGQRAAYGGGGGYVQRRGGGADGTCDGQRSQCAADIVVQRHGLQGVVRHRAAQAEAGHRVGDAEAAIVGPRPTLHQGAEDAAGHIVAGGRETGDGGGTAREPSRPGNG